MGICPDIPNENKLEGKRWQGRICILSVLESWNTRVEIFPRYSFHDQFKSFRTLSLDFSFLSYKLTSKD